MQRCGFCTLITNLVRRVMCVGSRRGSSDSYYRELGDQDTMKIEDKSSDGSEETEEYNPGCLVPSISTDMALLAMRMRFVDDSHFLTLHKRRKKRLLTRALCQEEALLDDMHTGQTECILDHSGLWEFNAFTLENVSGGRGLPELCLHLFHFYGLINYFKLDVAKAWKLFTLIEEGYHSNNPYHNSVHAADVTQALHCFLQQKEIRENIEPIEILAALLAAIAHDVDHPGVSQPFLIATSNHLAVLYKNTSVLENHHWRSGISCVMESGLLDHLNINRRELDQQIRSLILATDITRQEEYLTQFRNHMDTNTLDMKRREHRHLVLQIALKCADISNPCRSWDISQMWSLKVCDEFFRQGDCERELNMAVTSLCDRYTNTIPKIQTGFFKYVVTPLISEWHRFLQNDLSTLMMENLAYNQTQWEALAAEEAGEQIIQSSVVEVEVVEVKETSSTSTASERAELLTVPRPPSPAPEIVEEPNPPPTENTKLLAEHADTSNERSALFTLRSALFGDRFELPGECFPLLSARSEMQLADIAGPSDQRDWRHSRQQTFPPLNYTESTRFEETAPTAKTQETAEIDDADEAPAPEGNNQDSTESSPDSDKEMVNPFITKNTKDRRESAPVGDSSKDQNRPIPLASQPLMQRRVSMPADTSAFDKIVAKEKKVREVTGDLVRRTLSECWARRRGSAPDESRSRRTWLSRVSDFPRRSSLPTEMLQCTDNVKATDMSND